MSWLKRMLASLARLMDVSPPLSMNRAKQIAERETILVDREGIAYRPTRRVVLKATLSNQEEHKP